MENHHELQGFVLQNISRTGVHLGTGAYGEVEELCWNGTKCAGKCLHDMLLDDTSSSIMASKFVTECKMVASIRHPNVVQFLGLCFFPDYRSRQRLYLVMEKLHDNLTNLLDTKSNIQLSVKCSILLDVAGGLVHLHSHEPSIVHRDLTTRNILLTASMQAKIGDLGTARMIGTHKRMQHTPVPGTPIFMPPEANTANPKYDCKLDIFSFGQVMLHTLTQVYPYELLPPTHETPSGKIRGRTELERRENYIEILHSQLNKDHQLSKLVANCFDNAPRRRPTAKEVMTILKDFLLELENTGRKVNAFSKLMSYIQDKGGSTAAEGEGGDSPDGEESWRFLQRDRSATFIQSHILKGHPGVLKIYQSGGMFRRNAEWKEFVFKIAEGKLQYYTLKNRLQGELPLAKVECVKAFWSPNSTLFPFHIHFKGRGTPWILGAHTNEERQSWMEAIKPGSTRNQWVRSNIAKPSIVPTVIHTPPQTTPTTPLPLIPPPPRLIPWPQTPLTEVKNPHITTTNTATPSAPEVPPRPDLVSSLSQSGTYIPAHLLNTMIPQREGETAASNDDETVAENYYMPIVPQEDDVITELKKQFNPTQVDLLVQMFKTWVDPQQQQEKQQQQKQQQHSPEECLPRSKTISIPERSAKTAYLSVDSIPGNHSSSTPDPLSQRHLGYANEGRTSPYHCLADIAMDLKSNDWTEARRRANNRRSGIYCALTELFDKELSRDEDESPEFEQPDGNEELSVEEAYMRATQSFDQLKRKNAKRYSVGNRPRSASESCSAGQLGRACQKKERVETLEKPESTLQSVLRQASTDKMLDEEESNRPGWSKADTKAMDNMCDAPKTNRMSTYCDITEYNIFLPREDLVDFQQIAEGQFGPVYRANRQTETVRVPVALKPIKSSLSGEADVGSFLREMAILKCIRHPNVAQVFGLVDEANWIVMEYLPNGDLKNYLIYNKSPVSSLLKYMLDISMGMHYLSAKGFVHRKLAARNILVSENETCKVADLDLGSQCYGVDSAPTNIPEGVRDEFSTLRWMAPECLLSEHFSSASDVWSFGVVVWEMFNPSRLPYEQSDDKGCAERIMSCYALEIPRECPERLVKILRACWFQSPASRPSFLYISSLLSNILQEYPY